MSQQIAVSIAFLLLAQGIKAQVQQDSVVLKDSLQIFYASDAYVLTEEQKEQIALFIDTLGGDQAIYYIDAYTDDNGQDEYNEALSRRRSGEIADLLRSRYTVELLYENSHGERFAKVREGSIEAKGFDRTAVIRRYIKKRLPTLELIHRSDFDKRFAGFVSIDDGSSVKNLVVDVEVDSVIKGHVFGDTSAFELALPIDQIVEITWRASGCFPLTKKARLSKNSKTDSVAIVLKKMKTGAVIDIHVQFVGSKSILLPQYVGALHKLKNMMTQNPEVCLELAGHIHAPGTPITDKSDHMFGLSIARSLEIYEFLISQGVSSDRLVAKGYSNTKMKYPRATTPSQMSANRRVEAIVTDCDLVAKMDNDSVKDISVYKR